jgi:hypothetical protein
MIEIQKNYKLTLTEQQAKELYEFLRGAKDCGHLSTDRDLVLVYHELKKLFDSGIRSTENKDYNHLYAPGTK